MPGIVPDACSTSQPYLLTPFVYVCVFVQGTLPAAWSTLTKLTDVDVSDNNLTGSLPVAWSTMPTLATIDASDNSLEVCYELELRGYLTEG